MRWKALDFLFPEHLKFLQKTYGARSNLDFSAAPALFSGPQIWEPKMTDMRAKIQAKLVGNQAKSIGIPIENQR